MSSQIMRKLFFRPVSFNKVQQPAFRNNFVTYRKFFNFSSSLVKPKFYVAPRITFPQKDLTLATRRNFSLDATEVEARVMHVMKNFYRIKDGSIDVKPTSHFYNDLGLDSLDTVELTLALEDEFVIEIPDSEADKILTVADAIKFIQVTIFLF